MDPSEMQPPSLSHRTIDLTELIDLEKATRSGPPSARLAWARQLVRHVRRTLPPPAPTPAPSKKPTSEPSKALPTNLPTDPVLAGLLDQALTFILSLAHPAQGASAGAKDLVYAEALFVSADLSATGEFPTFKVKDLRTSFRSFESSARAGWQASWYRLGRDYEGVGDPTRAVECFERGVKGMDKSSLYRLGMALLLGQLGLAKDQARSIVLLRQAADAADEDLPIPAYLFAMLLAGEVDLPVSPASLLLPHQLPSTPTPESTLDTLLSLSRHYLLLSATLSYPPAQLRIGQAFEHATLGCPFDPLLSVQWYLVASQNGEEEADMGLAKWFLVGAEGYLEKNEGLAFSFAEKAARRGLGAGLFAVGYFYELGIGRERDLGKARKYYKRAAHQANQDAITRLAALNLPTPSPLSQEEHLSHVETKLVRKRTDAKARSERNLSIRGVVGGGRPPPTAPSVFVPAPPPPTPQMMVQPPTPVLDGGIREVTARPRQGSGSPQGGRSPQHHQQYQQHPHCHPPPPPNTPYAHPHPSSSHPGSPHQQAYPTSPHPQYQNHHPQPSSPYSPQQQQQQQQQQHQPPSTPQLKRYTLADIPLPAPPVAAPRAPTGPQTFSEMGFEGRKAGAETDCVVM